MRRYLKIEVPFLDWLLVVVADVDVSVVEGGMALVLPTGLGSISVSIALGIYSYSVCSLFAISKCIRKIIIINNLLFY